MNTQPLFLQWLNQLLSELFLLWHSLTSGLSNSWMCTMPFLIANFMKMSIWLNLLALVQVTSLLFASSIRLPMGLNRLLGLGMTASQRNSLALVLHNLSVILLLIYIHGGQCILILIYVDDIIVTGSSAILVQYVINKLNANFYPKQLGALD